VLAAIAGGAVLTGYYKWCRGASGPQTAVSFTIPKGATGTDVVRSLEDVGVLRCDFVSRYIVRSRGLSSSFKAGDYKLKTNMTLDDALTALAEGPIVKTVTVTVPEGWRLTQIAEEASRKLGIQETQIMAAAESGRFSVPPYLPAGSPTVEGFLFPKTYTFPRDSVTTSSLFRRLLDQFSDEVRRLPWGNAGPLGVTPYQVVIIASMIERETNVPGERTKVAAVIYNRLQGHDRLGIDATVQYIDPDPSNGITASDLEIDSPYNTRLHKGLPPTPIGSPGLPSLRAALQPADTDAAYFVLCGNHHRFTDTYKEFLQVKEQCQG